MGVMPETFKLRQHDTTFSPTGLWQFAAGAIGTDEVGSFNLTQDATHGAPTEVGGYIPTNQALQDFIYYRNNASDLEYVGAMSFACLFKATQYARSDGVSDQLYRILVNGRGGATDERYAFHFNATGHIMYRHQATTAGPTQTNYQLTLSELHYDLNRWHHLAFTKDSAGTTVKVYLDGALIGQSTLGAAATTSGTTYCNMGGMNGYNGGPHDGMTQASCVIFDKELTGDEIAYLANRCLGTPRTRN